MVLIRLSNLNRKSRLAGRSSIPISRTSINSQSSFHESSIEISKNIRLFSHPMRQAGAYSGVMYWKTGPHSLPLARIKKIMKKSGEEVKMISGEAPIVFSKACELFIEELTKRSWMIAMQSKKRMVHKEDVASAILATDVFDFLIGLIFNETATAATAAGDLGESETISVGG